MKLPDWTDSILHALGGGILTLFVLTAPGWIWPLLITLAGWYREVRQHDLSLSAHQWVEALSWGAGSLVVYGAVRFLS